MFSFYPHFEYSLAAIQLILSMTGMGATLTRTEFRAILRRPQTIAGVMVVQYVVLPALATVVAYLTRVSPGIALGMVLINSVPSGAFTNVFTYLGHGNVTLSIVITCASTAICCVMTPLAIDWFSAAELPNDFHIPFSTTVFPVVAFLLVPMIIGMWIARYFPRRKHQIAKWAVRTSLVPLAVIVVGSLGSGRIDLTEYGWGVPIVLGAGNLAVVGTARDLEIAARPYQHSLHAELVGPRPALAIAATGYSIPIAVCSFRVAMIPREILKKIRRIELRTNRIVTGWRGCVQSTSRSTPAVRAGQPIPRINNA